MEGDGFLLLYKRLESGSFQWPRTKEEVRTLTHQRYQWLMENKKIATSNAEMVTISCAEYDELKIQNKLQ